MPTASGKPAPPMSDQPDVDALRAENLALREQLLAARDQLVGMEMELGQALGERSVFERRVASLEATVHSRAWRLASTLLTPYRRLRR
ncbi:MAG: hypothetical protein ACRDYW_04525 [Acidimicrobiales bacterium]